MIIIYLYSFLDNCSFEDLMEHLEQLKITPLSLPLPEITQLWTALRARYVPSIAYMVSSVIL